MAQAAVNPVEQNPAAQTGEKPKRKTPVRNLGPRPAYVLVNAPESVDIKDIQIIGVTRKAEEALEAIDTGRARNYVRIMVK